MRGAHQHHPACAVELEIVAVATLTGEQPVVLESLLRARRAKTRRRRVELHLQGEELIEKNGDGEVSFLTRLENGQQAHLPGSAVSCNCDSLSGRSSCTLRTADF